MWVMVMFDLPVDGKVAKKRYMDFVKFLKRDGFWRLQYSVYARPCATDENAQVHRKRVQEKIPVEGQVRILLFTDKQFERMEVFFGKNVRKPEDQPEQLSFF